MEKNIAQGLRNEIWWIGVSSDKFMQFFEEKRYMLWLTGIFLLFLKGLKIFLNRGYHW